ncbi:MAG: aromatic amino acid lyase, partial [Candidatus Eremiobacteraeota bacterium]|nr:aromatic amino acid lyase [Candidatus Eremiobacteraeota bacterium]
MVMTAPAVELDGRHLTLEAIESAADGAPVRIAGAAQARVRAAREFVDRRFASGEAIYGVTTGFGRLANVPVDPQHAALLQLNLVRSHASGTGAPLEPRFVRAAGVLRANSLSAGHSGVRP